MWVARWCVPPRQPASRCSHFPALPLCRCDVDIRKDLYSNIVLSGELPWGALRCPTMQHALGPGGAALGARVGFPAAPACMARGGCLPGCCC